MLLSLGGASTACPRRSVRMSAHRTAGAASVQRSELDQLKEMTRLCSDTADLDAIRDLGVEDVTTNPSLLVKVMGSPKMESLGRRAKALSHTASTTSPRAREGIKDAADILTVSLGVLVLGLVPGRVSTETDARLAYDTEATVAHAMRLIELYAHEGIPPERVLVKVAATYQGVKAIEILSSKGVNVNATLIFSLEQAHTCAEAGVKFLSPFVGRIRDWCAKHPEQHPPAHHGDPGVRFAQRIYDYIKASPEFNHVEVMAASFRDADQIRNLAGIDEVTVSPELLAELAASSRPLERKLSVELAHQHRPEVLERPKLGSEEEWKALLGNGMAADLLKDGVERFARDADRLEEWLEALSEKNASEADE